MGYRIHAPAIFRISKEAVVAISTYLLIILWVYAAGSKLSDYDLFVHQLGRQPLPDWSAGVLARALPIVELGLALMLCFRYTRLAALALSFLLLLAFTLYVGLALSGAFGDIPCSCGGIFSFMRWRGHLVFNVVFTVMALAGYVSSRWHSGSEMMKEE